MLANYITTRKLNGYLQAILLEFSRKEQLLTKFQRNVLVGKKGRGKP